jgi:hypothetical protein
VFWDFDKKKRIWKKYKQRKEIKKNYENRWRDFSKIMEGKRGKVKYKCGKVEK